MKYHEIAGVIILPTQTMHFYKGIPKKNTVTSRINFLQTSSKGGGDVQWCRSADVVVASSDVTITKPTPWIFGCK